MARYPITATMINSDTDYSLPLKDNIIDQTLNRARISDLDSALAAIGEAEHLIQAQRRRIAYLETLSLSDEVTGLMNRRGYMTALQRELAAAKRDPQAHGVVMMFDLDDFKAVNDGHGHAAGDAYLSSFAAVLSNIVRPSDIVARIGGDEFAVILTRAAAKPGIARAGSIQKLINSKIMTWRQHTLQFKSSCGIATYTGRDIAEAVLVSADLKLYADKQKRKKT
ncbi:MAG: GGDEF domain-containing protein [Alphaproteobacteria bacterium]|nr:GGDEF domain-containing protein [Alphaproteobacteria bacterium]